MAIDTIITGAKAVLAAISGIKRVHDKAPDSLNELPAVVIIPDNGDITYPRSSSLRETRHRLKAQLFVVKGGSLPEAEAKLRPFVDSVPAAVDQAITLGGTCTAAGITRYQYGVLTYAEVDYLGITFDLTAEEITPVVFRA